MECPVSRLKDLLRVAPPSIPNTQEREFIVSLLLQLSSVQKLLIDSKQMDAAEVIEVAAFQITGLASFYFRENGKMNDAFDATNTIH